MVDGLDYFVNISKTNIRFCTQLNERMKIKKQFNVDLKRFSLFVANTMA